MALALSHLQMYLDPGLGEAGALGQLLPCSQIRIVGPLELLLQQLQLLRLEGGAAPSKLGTLVVRAFPFSVVFGVLGPYIIVIQLIFEEEAKHFKGNVSLKVV